MTLEEPTASSDDMIWEPMLVGRPASTHFTKARAADGYSPLARDNSTNEVTTHAALRPMGDEEYERIDQAKSHSDPEKAVVGALVAISALLAVKTFGPPAKRFWSEYAIPALKSTWGRTGKGEAAIAESVAIEVAPAALEPKEVVAVDPQRTGMSSTEVYPAETAAVLRTALARQRYRRHLHGAGRPPGRQPRRPPAPRRGPLGGRTAAGPVTPSAERSPVRAPSAEPFRRPPGPGPG